jgi:capsid assembly protease
MTIKLPYVAARLFNTPLMIDAGKAVAIASGLGGRIVDGQLVIDGPAPVDYVAGRSSIISERNSGWPAANCANEKMGRLGDPLGQAIEARGYGDDILTMAGSIAVIAIEGTLVHKGGWLDARSGETSYEGIQTQVLRAMRDDRVAGVVFEVDSFGGEAAGAFDTADLIADLSAQKPTLSILTDYALSAGYLLASAARQIVLPETGYAGSIGVIAMHVDFSRAIENDGIRVTVLSSGKRKDAGSPFKPLDAEVKASWQDDLDANRELFAAAVARYRGRRLSKTAALATEADVFRGDAAVEAGLADGVVRPSVAFNEFAARVRR